MTARDADASTAPRQRPQARWVVAVAPDGEAVQRLVTALLLPEPLCRLLVGRGYADPEVAKSFLGG